MTETSNTNTEVTELDLDKAREVLATYRNLYDRDSGRIDNWSAR